MNKINDYGHVVSLKKHIERKTPMSWREKGFFGKLELNRAGIARGVWSELIIKNAQMDPWMTNNNPVTVGTKSSQGLCLR